MEPVMRYVYVAAIIATVIAAPVFAADADPHAGHHPPAAAAPAPAPEKKNTAQAEMMDKCPMMQGAGSMHSMSTMDCSMMKAKPDSKSKTH
jgi:hypothetical protein